MSLLNKAQRLNAKDARLRFVEVVQGPEAFDLDLAALLIGGEEAPPLDVQAALQQLDALAARVARSLPNDGTVLEQMGSVASSLFGDGLLEGNRANYYDVENSVIHRVLEKGKGIPITLAIIAIEVGRRLNIPLQGVGFPFHFLVKHQDRSDFFIDAFNHGRILSIDDCRETLRTASNGNVPFEMAQLRPIEHRQILVRMLNNLKGIHLRADNIPRAIAASERILCLLPDQLGELRDRGLMHLKQGTFQLAVDDLSTYLDHKDDAPDRETVERHLEHAKEHLKTLH